MNGDVQRERFEETNVTIGLLDRNVPTTALVLRDDRDKIIGIPPLSAIIKYTAKAIDANAREATNNTQSVETDLSTIDVATLQTLIATLSAYKLGTQKTHHSLAVHLLPFTFGKWIAEIRDKSENAQRETTEERLFRCFNGIVTSDRFRYVTVHQHFDVSVSLDAAQKKTTQNMLRFENQTSLMSVLGNNLDRSPIEPRARNASVVGLYLCRTSQIKHTESDAYNQLKNFKIYSPSTPLEHVLADRLLKASQLCQNKTLYSIRRFAGKTKRGPILREIPDVIGRTIRIVRENEGMIQVNRLLETLTRILLLKSNEGRNGSKERGMLHNLRHATASRPSNSLVFFLNAVAVEEQNDERTFAPPVLCDFDLLADSSGDLEPHWAKSLMEMELLTKHDTADDLKGSTILTMAGFPFQCTFLLKKMENDIFRYCPHRFADQQDAARHVNDVHKGEGLDDQKCAEIAQHDSLLEDTDFGRRMQPENELELLRKLKLNNMDPEQLRLLPNLHDAIKTAMEAVLKNTRLLNRLQKNRAEAVEQYKAIKESMPEGQANLAEKKMRQSFHVRNIEITNMKKVMLSSSAFKTFLAVWIEAKGRKESITGNAYDEFLNAKEDVKRLDATIGEEVRRYREKVETLGGVDPGITPAGVPGGGMRPGKSNVVGVLVQDWIQNSRNVTAVFDANTSLMAVDREAAFDRVVSDHEESFGASNVIPAGTPLKAAEGWDEEDDDEQMVVEITPTDRQHQTNPRKRQMPREEDFGSKQWVTLQGSETPSTSTGGQTTTTSSKKQAMENSVPPGFEHALRVEVKRAFEALGIHGTDKAAAEEAVKLSFSRAIDPRFRDETKKMGISNALSASQIRTLSDPLRDNVEVLVLTDPRLIWHPIGVMMETVATCQALISQAHSKITGDEMFLCSSLADGICQLLQPHFMLSHSGLSVVRVALTNELLQKMRHGQSGHYQVVKSLIDALNTNLTGFWDPVLLRRYHGIQDPTYETKYVESNPEKTYAPMHPQPSVDQIETRIRLPIQTERSVISISPKDQLPSLRSSEAEALTRQVTLEVLGENAPLVRIRDKANLGSDAWIDRLRRGTPNAVKDPHVMCTWLREKVASEAECTDEGKSQTLRSAKCCICRDTLNSLPFEGWCCLSGMSSLDSVVEQALKDETDPETKKMQRERLRQELVNKMMRQSSYPSFHLWHRHCKKKADAQEIMNAHAEKRVAILDECPLCRTKYPRNPVLLPSMKSILQQIVETTEKVNSLIPLPSSVKGLPAAAPRTIQPATPPPTMTITSSLTLPSNFSAGRPMRRTEQTAIGFSQIQSPENLVLSTNPLLRPQSTISFQEGVLPKRSLGTLGVLRDTDPVIRAVPMQIAISPSEQISQVLSPTAIDERAPAKDQTAPENRPQSLLQTTISSQGDFSLTRPPKSPDKSDPENSEMQAVQVDPPSPPQQTNTSLSQGQISHTSLPELSTTVTQKDQPEVRTVPENLSPSSPRAIIQPERSVRPGFQQVTNIRRGQLVHESGNRAAWENASLLENTNPAQPTPGIPTSILQPASQSMPVNSTSTTDARLLPQAQTGATITDSPFSPIVLSPRWSTNGEDHDDIIEIRDIDAETAKDLHSVGSSWIRALVETDTEYNPVPTVQRGPIQNLTMYEEETRNSDKGNQGIGGRSSGNPETSLTELQQELNELNELNDLNAFEFLPTQEPGDVLENIIGNSSVTVNNLSELWNIIPQSRPDVTAQPNVHPVQRSNVVHRRRTPQIDQVPPYQATTHFTSNALGATGRSGPCNEGCTACAFLIPSSTQIGSYPLQHVIDCKSDNVIFVSVCHTCAIVNGTSHTIGTFRATVEMLHAGNSPLLQKCTRRHAPLLIGVDKYIDVEDCEQKERQWNSNVGAMIRFP